MQYPCLKFFKETVALIQTGQFTKPGEKSLGIIDMKGSTLFRKVMYISVYMIIIVKSRRNRVA